MTQIHTPEVRTDGPAVVEFLIHLIRQECPEMSLSEASGRAHAMFRADQMIASGEFVTDQMTDGQAEAVASIGDSATKVCNLDGENVPCPDHGHRNAVLLSWYVTRE